MNWLRWSRFRPASGSRMQRVPPHGALLALLAPLMLLSIGAAQAAPVVTGLDKMRSDICRSFKLDCRKGDASPPARHVPAPTKPAKPNQSTVKPPAPQPQEPKAQASKGPEPKPQQPAAAVPIPVPKPQPPATPPETAKTVVPSPREKPATAAASPPPPTPKPAELAAVPIPRERPSLLPSLPPVAGSLVAAPKAADGNGEAAPKPPESRTASIAPPAVTEAAGPSDCEQGLRNARVQFDQVPSSFGEANCPLVDPVRLHAIETPSGVVSFPEGPVFNCRFARQFALWASDTASAVVLAQTSKRLEKLATGPGYDCRHRNGDSSGKMSEHAAGDAVDITSFTMAGGTTIQMADAINPASPSYAVLRALRTTACGYFTTVLGPGANAAHKEHFHFDMGIHGKSASYRICE